MGTIFGALGNKGRVVLATILAVLAFGFGGYTLSKTEVACDNQVMTEEHVCDISKNGSTTTYSYEEMRSQQNQTGYIALGVGAVLVVVGVFFFIRARKPAAAPLPPAPAGTP